MDVQILQRNRFEALPDAVVTPIVANCYEVTIPFSTLPQRVRRTAKEADWEGAVLLLDDQETEPAVVSKADSRAITLAVVVL